MVGTPHDKVPDDDEVTVSIVDEETEPDTTEIVTVPAATPVASPLEPEELLIVATAVFEDPHVTVDVMVCVVPSE